MPHPTIKPEIMSPAGYWPQLHAAMEAGADAVYFGLKHFSARAKVGFGLDELPKVMSTLHRRGVKGYVTFNTLVFDHELADAARTLAAIAGAGADSIIVQDVGIAQLAHRLAPDLAIHGSTQMSITSAEGIELARRFGVSRVVLARELSLDEVRTIRGQTDCELEMFVHGALCVSYSGQCFSSEAWGGRSANRGQCAQACRLPYELMVDDALRPLADARYLLSPGDLYALKQMPDIVQLGVHALKIEGRYKDADYVALTTAAYRQAVDEAWAGRPLTITPAQEMQLEQVYSRGLGAHFVRGTNHQSVVTGRSPGHRGVLVGKVVSVEADRVFMQPDGKAAGISPLKAGDGLVFDSADWRSPQEREEGGFVYHVVPHATPGRRGQLELTFGNGAINFGRIRPGDWVWRSHDPAIDKLVRPFLQAETPVHRQAVRVHVKAHEGGPLLTVWTLVERPDIQIRVQSSEPLVAAQHRALDKTFAKTQLGRLGGTAYDLVDLELDIQGSPFAPASLLNSLRREAVSLLQAHQAQTPPRPITDPAATLADLLSIHTGSKLKIENGESKIHLLVRTPAQLDAALALSPASITLDYLDLYGLRPAVDRVQAAGIEARVASPRILKPAEQRVVNFLLRLGCPILVRSAGLLQALKEAAAHAELPPLIGDFSLNAANLISAETFLELGLDRLTPSHDLNAAQVAELAQALGGDPLEVIAYQHLPVFHTEHCVFCRFLSTGTTYKDCGHPCESHKVGLRDERGRVHPVLADVGCRNTIFGAEAQEASGHLDRWQAAGIRHFRLEFAHESGDEVRRVIGAFARTLAGKQSSAVLTQQLREMAPQGTTEGSLFIANDFMEIPLMA